MHKRFQILIGALVALAGTVLILNGFSATASAAVDNTPDDDTVAIIRKGAFTKQELLSKYDQNSYGDLPKVFAAFDLNRSKLANATYQNGIVWDDGRVTVDGKVVATNAITAGRWNNPKSDMTRIPGTERAYKMPTRHFVDEGQTALVAMKDGQFQFAVIKSCGNPVTATPTPKPKPPVEKPKPAYKCVDLTAHQISRTKYRFDAEATASGGAEINRYEFGFGDGKGITVSESSYTYEYSEPGTYKASVVVHVKVDGKTVKANGSQCTVNVTIKPEPKKPEEPAPVKVCNPDTKQIITVPADEADDYAPVDSPRCKEEEKPPVVIAKTGPAEFIGGGLGLGSITAAGYYWASSRRQLIDRMLGR